MKELIVDYLESLGFESHSGNKHFTTRITKEHYRHGNHHEFDEILITIRDGFHKEFPDINIKHMNLKEEKYKNIYKGRVKSFEYFKEIINNTIFIK